MYKKMWNITLKNEKKKKKSKYKPKKNIVLD